MKAASDSKRYGLTLSFRGPSIWQKLDGSQHSRLDTTHILECCEKNSRLYPALENWLGQSSDWAHLSHLKTCLWMVIALIHSGEVNLTRWLPHIPCRGRIPQSLHAFEEYGLRFDIEENFLDEQSNGWNVQKSAVRSVCALSRLWFILAVAPLYVTAQGLAVVATGHRRWVDPHWFRGNSYFRIGWDWVKTALGAGQQLIQQVRFNGHRDPQPAMASRQQHRKRIYRIEFTVRTYRYPAD